MSAKSRPILMGEHEVRAILAGTKTQTRRIAKPRRSIEPMTDECPFGLEGGRLWVRETWYCDDYRVQRGPYIKPDDMDVDEAQRDGTLVYRASSGDRPYEAEQPIWRPSIHMPRWASRITLEVTGVRVERPQKISEADAMAEGVDAAKYLGFGLDRPYARAFSDLWESINGPGSWAANPWVWVIEHRMVQGAEA